MPKLPDRCARKHTLDGQFLENHNQNEESTAHDEGGNGSILHATHVIVILFLVIILVTISRSL